MYTFLPADILIPNLESMEKWSVIACDQFTSQQDYWDKVEKNVGDTYSTLNLVLPEIYLNENYENRIVDINSTMEKYLNENIFKEYRNVYIYVERTLLNGDIRRGIVGMVDLEQYDFYEGSQTKIRASEKTVLDRIPPRKKIRKDAPIELPHILLLCDDENKLLVEPVSEKKSQLKKIYDFDLMEQGGHITGYLIEYEHVKEFQKQLALYDKESAKRYLDIDTNFVLYATGDGNHSLATAKACFEDIKKKYPLSQAMRHPARYALVELENLHDPVQKFEPIHRFIKDTNVEKLLEECKKSICSESGYPIQWITKDGCETIYLDPKKGQLDVGILQNFLDKYLKDNEGVIDYIHGEDSLKELVQQDNSVGFLLPVMKKNDFFRAIVGDGTLPRKTFSMGHAQEKRYYLEARKIK